MKNCKAIGIILFVAMFLAIITYPAIVNSGKAFADTSTITSAEFVIGMNQYFVNDQTPGVSMDAAPYIDASSGRTLVPVRYLGDALGANTSWDGTSRTVTVTDSSTTIALVIGNTVMTVNGQEQVLDQAPVINNSRTYLPARQVAEALGYNVSWDAKYQIVVIYPAATLGPPNYGYVITQAQQWENQNAGAPACVQKLDSTLGITMTSDGTGDWWYDPDHNPDGSENTAFDKQIGASSYVTAHYSPGASQLGNSSLQVSINCVGANLPNADPNKANWDISPLQTVLEAFFPGQNSGIQQAMTDAQNCVANATKYHGGIPQPADILTINGTQVGVCQGTSLTFVVLTLHGV